MNITSDKKSVTAKYPQTEKDCKAYPIVAIDVGTTFSGIAYSIAFEPPKNSTYGETLKMDILTCGADSNSQSGHLKSQTILVISMEHEEKYTIGTGAYHRAIWEKHSYIVQDFKMNLDILSRRKKEGQILLRNTKVDLICVDPSRPPVKWSLSKVFIKYLRVCRQIATKKILSYADTIGVRGVTEQDINWVITVPAIWTDQARIFMREVAEKAGFLGAGETAFSSRLSICLEPEGAAISVMSEYTDWNFLKNRRIVIIDLGGGTADFTHHFVEEADFKKGILNLTEVEPPSGGDWGGKRFEESFLNQILKPLLGPQSYDLFVKNIEAYSKVIQLDLFQFKICFNGKQSFCFNIRGFEQFHLGISTDKIIENAETLKRTKFPEILIRKERFVVPPTVMKLFFLPILDPVKQHITEIVRKKNNQPIHYAFLAGGMGRIDYVCEELHQHWTQLTGDPQTFLRAKDSSLAVVTGGARFGYDSDIFAARKARTNYGTDVRNKGFKKLISKGEDLDEIEKRTVSRPFVFHPTRVENSRIHFGIYETEDTEASHLNQCSLVTETKLQIDKSLPYDKRKYLITLRVERNVLTGYVRAAHQKEEEAVRLKWSSR